jgi:hypothetical protein
MFRFGSVAEVGAIAVGQDIGSIMRPKADIQFSSEKSGLNSASDP